MTVKEFYGLNADERAAVAMQGIFLDIRLEDGLKVALYTHPNFYAEVYYDGTSNRIVKCRAFTATSELANYINLN